MNLYGYLALLIALGGALGWGTWERGSYEKAEADLASLKDSYAQASVKAISAAQKLTAQRDAEIRDQGFRAAAQAQSQRDAAEKQATDYQTRLITLSKQYSDLGHRCSVTVQPPDTLPGL